MAMFPSSSPATASLAGRLLLVALALFSLAALAGLFYPFPTLKDSEVWQHWMDFCHFPLLLAWQLLLSAGLRTLGWRYPVLKSALLLLVLAAVVEVVQGRFDRSPSLDDWITGAVAISVGVLLARGWGSGTWARVGLVGLVLVGLSWSAYPGLLACVRVWQDRSHFPQLLALESDDRLPPFWYPLPTESATTASLRVAPCNALRCVMITTVPGAFSGIARHFEGSDWHGYRALVLEVQSAVPLTLHVRIDDDRPAPRFDQRFNREWHFPGGQQLLRLPLTGPDGIGQAINLGKVHRLALFVAPVASPVVFRLVRAELE